MTVSNCCGAEPRGYSDKSGAGDQNTKDFGVCADCGERCEYIEICDRCCEENCVCGDENIEAKVINMGQKSGTSN